MFHVHGLERTTLVLLALGISALATYWLYSGLTAGPIKPVNVSDLEHGKPAPGVYLRVHGRALWSDAFSQSEGHGYTLTLVPVISDSDDAKQHASVFLEIRTSNQPRPTGSTDRADYDGTAASVAGLSGDAIKSFHAHGITESKNYILLKPNETPHDLTVRGLGGFAFAAACLAFVPVVGWLKRLQHRN